MNSIGALDFGMVIAYLLPGFLAFFGLRYASPATDQLFLLSFAKDNGIGVELSIVLFALVAGVAVSALRSSVLDLIQRWSGVKKPKFDFSKLKDPNVLKSFEATISNTYRFAQFYGNAFIALSFLAVMRAWGSGTLGYKKPVFVIIVASLIVLFVAHRQQLRQTYETIGEILK